MTKLKASEMLDIQHFAKHHDLGVLLSEMKHWGFQVGDTLIRYLKKDDGTLKTDLVSEKCPVPKKYRVVIVDELGVPWVKQLSVRGGLGKTLYCLAQSNPRIYRYKVDPNQIDSQLLGIKYDPRSEYRVMRQTNPNYGGNNETGEA